MNDRDRLLRIFNKNTLSIDCYTAEEIKIAFAKADHSAGTEKEQLLYSRFFKECNSKDLKNLCSDFKVNVRDVKKIYITSPYGTLKDVAKVWNTKFRLKSIIVHKILPRDHDKYTEIDNFEIYELTPCIAYEMAIRNQDVLDIYKKYEKISNMMLEEKYLYKRYIAEHDLTFDEKYEYTIMQKHRTYSKLIDADYKIFIDDYINICTELDITHLKLLEEKLEDELINEYLIYPTGYYRKITGASYFYEDKILNSKKYASKFSKDGRSEGLILEEKIYDDFIHIEGLYSNSDKYSVNNIVPNFNSQLVMV